jgi:hypothetical protein
MPRLRSPLPVLVVLAALLLTGCSGGGGGRSNGAASGLTSTAGGKADSAAAGAPAGGAAPAQRTALQQRQIIRTATLELTVPDVDRAAQAAVAAVTAAGGRADADDRNTGPAGRHAHLVLRVPAAGLDALISRVVGLGHEVSRSEQGSDVTTEVADVNARVTELQISVSRLQDFLRHSGSITDLLALESQLTQRESDLQSTIAQQRALADQVSLATLTVELSPPSTGITGKARQLPGFPGAIRASLHALLFTGRLLLALLGYLAPFLPIAAVAGYLALRYRRPHRVQPDAGGSG